MQLPFATNKIRCNYRCTVSSATLHLGWYVCGCLEFQIWVLFIALTHTCYFGRWCGSRREKSGTAWSHSFRGPSAFFGLGALGCTFDLLLNSLRRTIQPRQGPPVAALNAVWSLTLHVSVVSADLNEVQRPARRELHKQTFRKRPLRLADDRYLCRTCLHFLQRACTINNRKETGSLRRGKKPAGLKGTREGIGGEYNQNILCTSLKNVIMNIIIKCNYCMQIKAEKETKKSVQMLCVWTQEADRTFLLLAELDRDLLWGPWTLGDFKGDLLQLSKVGLTKDCAWTSVQIRKRREKWLMWTDHKVNNGRSHLGFLLTHMLEASRSTLSIHCSHLSETGSRMLHTC